MKGLQFLILFLSFSSWSQSPSVQEVRTLYKKAAFSEEAAEQLLEQLEAVDKENPVLLAYRASARMLMAKYAFSPFGKFSHFNKGKKMLQQAVDAAPEEAEIRFLRFTLQAETPGFLGYKGCMEEDIEFLLRELPEVKDEALRGIILSYFKNSDYLTEAERQHLFKTNNG